jgi:hypothetical protein
MKTKDLIGYKQNSKTYLPIRYVSPIVSEALVRTSLNTTNNIKYQQELDYDTANILEAKTYSGSNIDSSVSFHNNFLNYTPEVHLSNQGLFKSDLSSSFCCPSSKVLKYSNGIISQENVYDPRFSGFCTDEWRSFINPILGRVEYDYSDIDSVKRENFIQRHSLDEFTLRNPGSAVSHFSDVEIEKRNDYQLEWLQRHSSDRLQSKMYPKHTNGKKLN